MKIHNMNYSSDVINAEYCSEDTEMSFCCLSGPTNQQLIYEM